MKTPGTTLGTTCVERQFPLIERGVTGEKCPEMGGDPSIKGSTSIKSLFCGIYLIDIKRLSVIQGSGASSGATLRGILRGAESSGERSMSQRALGLRLEEKGFERTRTGGAWGWKGLILKGGGMTHHDA